MLDSQHPTRIIYGSEQLAKKIISQDPVDVSANDCPAHVVVPACQTHIVILERPKAQAFGVKDRDGRSASPGTVAGLRFAYGMQTELIHQRDVESARPPSPRCRAESETDPGHSRRPRRRECARRRG